VSPTAQPRWLEGVAERVNAQLERLLADKRAEARKVSPHAEDLVDAVSELTLRGGKRLRPATAYAAFRAVAGKQHDGAGLLPLAMALELLQTYLLIQDDWMDGDDQRRGGPSVHAAFARARGHVHLGASLAILAADLAAGMAWELLASAPFPDHRVREAFTAFGKMHEDVVYGQQLDLLGHEDIALVHHLKTGSYTVRGPLRLGALLGDAKPEQLAALERFGTPLGLAFQLRDDLLGAFGDRSRTGKPVGIDLRVGKHSALIAEARRSFSSAERARFDQAFGNAAASDQAVDEAHAAFLGSGARDRIETRLASLADEAQAALEGAPLQPEGVALLADLASRLIQRDR
jgi:geranylgeranyl diphosphate synthase, type I